MAQGKRHIEDLIEVVEEVKGNRHTLPLAIVLTLLITAVVYTLLVVTAIAAVGPAELGGSDAPLATVYARLTGGDPFVIASIGILAIVNGALIQIIMASRVLYGLARRGQVPAWFGRVNAITHTPVIATVLAGACVLGLALLGGLAGLAQATSTMMLAVFAIVNLALVRIKATQPAPDGLISIPAWVPLLGFVVCTGFVLFSLWQWAAGA